MKRSSIVSIAMVALVGSAVRSYAAESETFTGVASASGTYKRPLLIVDGKRYELKASDKADASVTEVLTKFSKGDRGTYVVKGTRGIVKGVDGIIVDSITPDAILKSPAAAQATPTATSSVIRANERPKLEPGKTFTIEFPEMPPTFQEQMDKKGKKPMMSVFLPGNYSPNRKFPVLIYLHGAWGGDGDAAALGVARAISGDNDFICVALPLFKVIKEDIHMFDDDSKLTWQCYRTMLARLAELVPNMDPACRVLGGFSNGAHATTQVINNSNGEAARWFTAFFMVEGGGHMNSGVNGKTYPGFELIKGKPVLFCYGNQGRPVKLTARQQAFNADGVKAGVKVTMHHMEDATGDGVGHDFPATEYPFVSQWIRTVGLNAPR